MLNLITYLLLQNIFRKGEMRPLFQIGFIEPIGKNNGE